MKTIITLTIMSLAALTFFTEKTSAATANSIPQKPVSGNDIDKNNPKTSPDPGSATPRADNSAIGKKNAGTSVRVDHELHETRNAQATIMKRRNFSIPFTLTPSENTGPFSVELLSSGDRGKTWLCSAKIDYPSSQKEFFFRAERDGEYWFMLQTIFPGGNKKTSPIQVIQVKTEQSEVAQRSIPDQQNKGENHAPPSTVTTPKPQPAVSTGSQQGVPPKPAKKSEEPVAARKAPVDLPKLKLPSQSASETGPANTMNGNREERAKRLLELAAFDPAKKEKSSAPAATPKPTAPKTNDLPKTATTKTADAAKTTNQTQSTEVRSKPVNSSAKKTDSTPDASTPAKGENLEKIAFPGQIKSISLGRTQSGEPTVMVRWFRSEEVGLPAGTKGSLRIERSEKSEGPWTTIVSDLQKDQNGYWWKATQLDTIPFYLRTVSSDETGKETVDQVTQKIELAEKLHAATSPPAVRPATGADHQTASDAKPASSQVAKTGAKSTEKRFLSKLFNKGNKIDAWQTPPTPEESLARSNMNEGDSMSPLERRSKGVTGIPAATYSSARNAAMVNEPSPAFQMNKEDADPDSTTSTAQPQSNAEDKSHSKVAAQNVSFTRPAERTAGRNYPPQRNYDPGVINWNPLFTEGFGALFQGRPAETNRVERQPIQNGMVETPPAPKKRSIFTPPERYNALPRQTETGYNAGSGIYSGPNNAPADPNLVMSGSFDQGTLGPSNQPGGLPTGMNSSEIIYLDQHGNRIANPFASGAMNPMPGNIGATGTMPGGPVEGGQYMVDPSGNLVPYNPSKLPFSQGQETLGAPFSPAGSGTIVPGSSTSEGNSATVPGSTRVMPGPN